MRFLRAMGRNPLTTGMVVIVMMVGVMTWRVEVMAQSVQNEAAAVLSNQDVLESNREVLESATAIIEQQDRTQGALNCVLGLLFLPVDQRPNLVDQPGARDRLPPGCDQLTDEEYHALLIFVEG